MSSEPVRAARQHFMDTFGNPTRALAFGKPKGPSRLGGVEVGVFGQSPAPHVLATAGASAIACADGVRREWVWIFKDPPTDRHCAMLADIASMGAKIGGVLALELPPFVGVLLLDARALPDDRRAFDRKDAIKVEVGWVIPVRAEEARHAGQHGADVLFAHWQATRPDLTDLSRAPEVPRA